MATHVQHHFVPRFLLEEWTGVDHRLTVFRWANGSLLDSRCSPKAVAKVKHLYSRNRDSQAPDVRLEKDYFGPLLDDPAAPIHQKLLAQGVPALRDQERLDWSRFLLAQLVRVPRAIAFIRELGDGFLRQEIRKMATNAGRPESVEYFDRPENVKLLEDEGLKVMRRFIESPAYNRFLLHGHWTTIDIERGAYDALLTDSPVAYLGDLNKNAFVFMLPLSPRRLFVAASTREDLDRLSAPGWQSFVKAANRHMVRASDQYIYATNPWSHKALVEKYLPRNEESPPRGGLNSTFWRRDLKADS